jgi:hypothetical protein
LTIFSGVIPRTRVNREGKREERIDRRAGRVRRERVGDEGRRKGRREEWDKEEGKRSGRKEGRTLRFFF